MQEDCLVAAHACKHTFQLKVEHLRCTTAVASSAMTIFITASAASFAAGEEEATLRFLRVRRAQPRASLSGSNQP